jgi:hypothetical protein
MIDYHKKYLKYKKKYLEAKKMYGGLSKIKWGYFNLGRLNKGFIGEGGPWRFRADRKDPLSSTIVEIELWNYLYDKRWLPNHIQKAIPFEIVKRESNRDKWIGEVFRRDLYKHTIENFPTLLADSIVAEEEAIFIMNKITKILEHRITEYQFLFREGKVKKCQKNHLRIIQKYIDIYANCVMTMNNRNLFNGTENKQESKGVCGYSVMLYTGNWVDKNKHKKIKTLK